MLLDCFPTPLKPTSHELEIDPSPVTRHHFETFTTLHAKALRFLGTLPLTHHSFTHTVSGPIEYNLRLYLYEFAYIRHGIFGPRLMTNPTGIRV